MTIPPSTRNPLNILWVAIICIIINALGHILASIFNELLYLDMIGTCIGAMLLGPWFGALIGLVTNVILEFFQSGFLEYAVVNMTGAILIGYWSKDWTQIKFETRDYKKLFWFVIWSGLSLGILCSLLAIYVKQWFGS